MEEVSSHAPEPLKSFEPVSNSLNFEHPPAQQSAGTSDPFGWVTENPEMARSVLAKTEDELIHGLSALMRNKVELERAQHALAHLLRQVDDARRELTSIKNQIRVADDELSTRMAEHTRVLDEISHQSGVLQTERIRQLEQQESVLKAKTENTTIFQQLSQTRAELAEGNEQLTELTLKRKTLQDDVLRLTQEREGLEAELAPLRTEIDGRIVAREALIEQISVIEKHLQYLGAEKEQLAVHTPTLRDQYLFWEEQVSRLSEKANDLKSDHEQKSAEMQRIETEKTRLIQERDRVGAELSNYEQKLNTLRFNFAEVQERLEDARQALISTEQEHDEAVARLITAREEQAALERSLEMARKTVVEQRSPEPVLTERTEAQLHPVDAPVVPPSKVELEEEFPTQALDLLDSCAGPLTPEPVEAVEPVEPVQSIEEPKLPLEISSELPSVSPAWDSYTLESEFFTEEKLDARKVVHLMRKFPGLTGSMILRGNGPALASDLPEELHPYFASKDRLYARVFENWPDRVSTVPVGENELTTNRLADQFVTVVPSKDLYLVVSHTSENLRRGLLTKLTTIANELSQMYPVGREEPSESDRDVAGMTA
jgi:predicted  nucleic acid-binding Zn-ribbon protein